MPVEGTGQDDQESGEIVTRTDEESTLLQEGSDNPVGNAILSIINKENQVKNEFFLSKSPLKIISILLALPAGIPFIQPARSFAGDNIPYGYALATGTVLSYANVCIWSSLSLIEDIFETPTEVILLIDKSKVIYWSKILAAFGLAAMSTVPMLYQSYIYNDGAVIYPIIDFFSSIMYRTYGFTLLLRKLQTIPAVEDTMSCLKIGSGRITLRFKKDEIRAIRERIILTLQASSSSISRINIFPNDLYKNSNKEAIRMGLQKLLQELIDFPKNSSKNFGSLYESNLGRGVSKFVGGIMPFSQIILNSYLTYLLISGLNSNLFLISLVILLVVLPEASLLILSGRKTLGNIYNIVFSALRKDDIGFLTYRISQKVTIAFYILILFVSTFSYGAGAHAIQDKLPDNLKEVLLPWFIAADSFFHLYVLTANANRTIRMITHLYKKPEIDTIREKSEFASSLLSLVERLNTEQIDNLTTWLETGGTRDVSNSGNDNAIPDNLKFLVEPPKPLRSLNCS